MNPLIQSKNATILPVLIALTLGCFGLSPQARAVCQEGCLTNFNTVLGEDALLNNTGTYNTAIGNTALQNNTSGDWNTATGALTLINNTTGEANTATGQGALAANTTGSFNIATGGGALVSNTTGDDNTAIGFEALLLNTTGSHNTAIGELALWHNIGGSNNVALGDRALANNPTGNNNIAIGASSGSHLITGSNNIDIGNIGKHGDSGKIRIGTTQTHKDTSIAGISGATVPTGVAVLIDNSGHLGTTTSSARFKEAVKPMDKASETLFALRPVTFRYKHELDPDGIAQFGLVAEEVEKVNPDLVARDDQGKPYTVRYEAVNAMLLNEFLKEHRKVETQASKGQEQDAIIAQLKSAIAQQHKDFQTTAAQQQGQIKALKASLKAQAEQIQKVSDQIKTQALSPRVVANN